MAQSRRKTPFEKALADFELIVRKNQMMYYSGSDSAVEQHRRRVVRKYRAMQKKWEDLVNVVKQKERDFLDGVSRR